MGVTYLGISLVCWSCLYLIILLNSFLYRRNEEVERYQDGLIQYYAIIKDLNLYFSSATFIMVPQQIYFVIVIKWLQNLQVSYSHTQTHKMQSLIEKILLLMLFFFYKRLNKYSLSLWLIHAILHQLQTHSWTAIVKETRFTI